MGKLFVGIDVSRDHLDVHVRPSGEGWGVPNTLQGRTALVRQLAELGPQAGGAGGDRGIWKAGSAPSVRPGCRWRW